ncbi:MAG: hypothetical protein EU549_01725 [Promethearchaeota archaeon]|nr:MAG: hypothetical protein EU549_01725 [Candidatus Lokiarchaeota archaeon]
MKNGDRKEPNWKKIDFKEPYKVATERLRNEILSRKDFDPASLFQFSIFMAKALLQMLEDVEENFGPAGQKVCNEALIKIGRDIAEEMFADIEKYEDIPPIELVSFIATQINTVAWTSVEDPRIINDKKCEFDILWCPLEDVYKPFDCRIQRYLVQGILDYVREKRPDVDFDVEFLSTIPAGAETCKFQMTKKEKGKKDKWVLYSKILEKRALKKWRKKQKENSEP